MYDAGGPFQSEVETAIRLPGATRATGGGDPRSAVPLYIIVPTRPQILPRPGWSWSRLKSSR